ncbi:MAG: collagen-like protein [Tenuifilaceae bacterium]|jgi:hypothetical protein|nr:collagen-like protein [Tenuifilaceae bacterium]
MKRKLLITIVLCLNAFGVWAQAPLGFNYQAVVRSANGEIIANQQVSLRLSILSGSTTGTTIFSEEFSPTTNEFGLVNIVVGQGSAKVGTYSQISWSSANFYLKIELDASGGSNFTEMGITQLMSVPFANFAFDGNEGKSAYQIWLSLGFTGTEQDFISSLKGATGETGPKGEKGEPGMQGDQGISILWLGSLNVFPETPGLNNAFYHSEHKTSYVFDGSLWQLLTKDGNDGATGAVGPAGPKGEPGEPGTGLLNRGEWISETIYNSGDFVFAESSDFMGYNTMFICQVDDLTSTIPPKDDATSWIEFHAPQGPQGPAGPAGQQGEQGIQGNQGIPGVSVNWRGSFDTHPTSGLNYAYYNTTDKKSYIYNGSSWQVMARDGSDGIIGVGIQSTINNGDGTYTFFYTDGTSFTTANLKGETGASGSDGKTILSGTTPPITAQGTIGDYYLNTTTNILYGPKSEAGWGTGISLVGPEGAPGPSGTTSWEDQETIVSTSKKVGVGTSTPEAMFEVKSDGTSKEGVPLFEVKNSKGETVFAVYENSVKVFIDETETTKTRGGFAVSGRTTSKTTRDILTVDPVETKIIISEPAVDSPGGLTIASRTDTEGVYKDVMSVTPTLTQVFVDENPVKTRGGFAVSGRTTSKEPLDLLHITSDYTRVFVDETTETITSGFAITKRSTSDDVLNVSPSLTQIYVDSPAKTRGGFAVSGRTTSKEPLDLLNITPLATRIYVDETSPESPSAFAITKRSNSDDVMTVSPGLTQVYVDETTAKTRGGFAVSGRTSSKGISDILNVNYDFTRVYVGESSGGFAVSGNPGIVDGDEILKVSPGLTEVFVEETIDSKTRGGFAVSGRTSSKAGELYNVLTVVPERTDVYIKPSTSKNALPRGFSVTGLNEQLSQTELFSVSDGGTYVANNMAIAPKLFTNSISSTTQTSAIGGGNVLDDGGVPIITSGIVYQLKTLGIPTLTGAEILKPNEGGIVYADDKMSFPVLKMADLAPGFTYIARAFATNSDQLTGYGLTREFITAGSTTLSIKVLDSGEEPIAGAMVTLWPLKGKEPLVSGPSATHEFQIPNGIHSYLIEAPGYIAARDDNFEVRESQSLNVNLSIADNPQLTVNVKNQYGKSIQGVGITVDTYGPNNTDITGNAIFNIPTGSYPYSIAVPEGYSEHPGGMVEVTTELMQTFIVTITENPKATFKVTYQGGAPAKNVGISLTTNSYEPVYITTNSLGIAVAYLPEAKWDYLVNATTSGVLSMGTTDQTVDVTLYEEVSVTIVVTDKNGTPMPNAQISLYNGLSEPLILETGTQGITTTSLMPGSWQYTIDAFNSQYTITTGTIEVVGGVQNQTFNLIMWERSSITFVVTDPLGVPIYGAYVNANLIAEPFDESSGETNEMGKATLQLGPGEWRFSVYMYESSYREYIDTITVVFGQDQSVSVSLEEIPKYTITFIAQDPENNPIEGVQIYLGSGVKTGEGSKASQPDFSGTLYTDIEGKAVFENVPEGDYYSYNTYHYDYEYNGGSIVVDEDKTVVVVLTRLTKGIVGEANIVQ